MSADPAIKVERLVKIYKQAAAVDGISFAIAPGSITGLLGGNGAGKTTTIAMIMGLLTPTSGAVTVLGSQMPEQRYQVLHRMNFESPYVEMPMRLTIRQNLKVFGMLYGVPKLAERIEQLGEGGGYILSPCHNIQPDVPTDNIVALFDHARSYVPSFMK